MNEKVDKQLDFIQKTLERVLVELKNKDEQIAELNKKLEYLKRGQHVHDPHSNY
jgi:hypothetical protein